MIKGLFSVKVDNTFEVLEYTSLRDEEKAILSQGIAFDQNQYLVLRLPIKINSIKKGKHTSKYVRRKSFEKVTHAIIRVQSFTPGAKIYGMLPNSIKEDGEMQKTYKEKGVLEQKFPSLTKVTISGEAEQKITKKDVLIIASRTSSEAQWVVNKKYLDQQLGINLIFLIKKGAEANIYQARFKIVFCDKGREIISPRTKTITYLSE